MPMTTPPLRRRHVVLGAAAALALPSLGRAQAFPARPVKYICPWPAGGSTDAVIRAMRWSPSLPMPPWGAVRITRWRS